MKYVLKIILKAGLRHSLKAASRTIWRLFQEQLKAYSKDYLRLAEGHVKGYVMATLTARLKTTLSICYRLVEEWFKGYAKGIVHGYLKG